MSVYKNLKPNVRTIQFIGGTGDGKTESATVVAAPSARQILLKGVGQTNSTITEREMIYTTAPEFQHKIVVGVKLDESILTRTAFTEMIAISWAKVVKDFGKSVASIIGRDCDTLSEVLKEQIDKKNNIKAVISFLSVSDRELFIEKIVNLYKKYKLGDNNYAIYNTVKNSLSETETKNSSRKFLSAIQSEVERYLDMMSDEFRNEMWTIWSDINDKLTDVFFTYFSKDDVSGDGYYFKEISLEAPDEEFIAAMFTSNNLQGGERLSLEVMCKEINIYAPMNQAIVNIINGNDKMKNVFSDSYGNIVFGILDTRGLYHADNTEDENSDYCSELIFRAEIDALVMVVPLYGDSNEKKISELYRDIIKNFNKQIPIFMLHNKLDLFIDFLNKEVDNDDPLAFGVESDLELSESEIIQRIEEREAGLRENLQNVQGKARKNLKIKSLSCCLKKFVLQDKGVQKNLMAKYSVLNAWDQILNDVAVYLEDDAFKIPIKLRDSQVYLSIDENCFKEIVHNHIIAAGTDKKVFTPGMSDIALSLGKTPHGNAYNAMCRRLKNGEGYTSNINEAYFYNCKSFSINFTANLRNFLSDEVLNTLISRCIHIEGGRFGKQEDREAFYKAVQGYVNSKEFVSILLYDNAVKKAEETAFSFKWKFQNFLQNSMSYFNLTMIDEAKYIEALQRVIVEAADRALCLNVTYK